MGVLAFPCAGADLIETASLPKTILPPVSVESGVVLPTQEELIYSVRWGVIHAGTSSLSVKGVEDVDGHSAYHLVAEAKSAAVIDAFYKVRDRNEAWLDTTQPRSLRYARNIREGSYRIEETVALDHTTNRYTKTSYRIDKDRHEVSEGDITPNVLDVLSSLYYVRTLPLEVGKSYTFDVHSGKKVWPLVMNVKKRTTVKVRAGKFDCLLVEPALREPGIFVSKGKKLEVWLTADARHLPVLMRSEIFIGHVSAELIKDKSVKPSYLSQIQPNQSSS